MTLPILYILTNTNAIQEWQVSVADDTVTTVYGQRNGKKQTTSDNIKGKNIGKKNETKAWQQAELKAKQMWDKKIKSGYTENLSEAEQGETNLPGIDPMLAFPIEDKEKYVTFPAWIQPKLDGFRCIAIVKNGEVTLYSRTRKVITTVPHINAHIKLLFKKDIILDGELYNHELKADFPRLAGIIKRDEIHPDSTLIQYHIYDVVENDMWEARIAPLFDNIKSVLPNSHLYLKIVPAQLVYNRDEMDRLFTNYLVDGYEGAMYRAIKGGYENKRSPNLLKIKTMQDAEFQVVGVEEGNGKLVGKAGSFICVMSDGQFFDAKMKGTNASLEDYLVNFDKYKGRMLTVQFQGFLPSGKPRFPVGLRFREEL